MVKRPPLILEDVGAAIEKLRADGEKVTVRNVHRMTGGSFSTIGKLIQEYIEQEQADKVGPEIDNDLLNALRKGVRRHVDAATSSLKRQLESAQERHRDVVSTMETQEVETATTVGKFECQVSELDSQNRTLSSQLLVAEDKIKGLVALVVKERKVRNKLEKKVQQLLVEIAAKDARIEVLQNQ